MISYEVQAIDSPQDVPMTSGQLTWEEAEARRRNLIKNKGMKESDVWIVKVEKKKAA